MSQLWGVEIIEHGPCADMECELCGRVALSHFFAQIGIPLIGFLGDAAVEGDIARKGPETWLSEHRVAMHDPRDPHANPCCWLCCDCPEAYRG